MKISFTDKFFTDTTTSHKYHYIEWNNPQLSSSSNTILCLHGSFQTCHTWDEFAEQFFTHEIASKYRILCMDLRGHGDTQYSNDYSLSGFANDITAIIQNLQLDLKKLVFCITHERS